MFHQKQFPLSSVSVEGLQIRVATDRAHVDDITELFGDEGEWPAELPPVDVFGSDPGPYFVGDGHHRIQAAQEAGCAEIPCKVHPGSKTDALWFACGANASHGLRRTSEDKRNAVRTAYQLDPGLSDREIARRCRVSHDMANYVLRPLRQAPLSDSDSEPATASESLPESDSEESCPMPSAPTTPAEPAPDIRTDARGRQMNVSNIGKGKPAREAAPDPSLTMPTPAEAAQAFESLGAFEELDRHLAQAAKMIARLSRQAGAELLRSHALKLTRETRNGEPVERYHSPDLNNLRKELEHWRPYAPCPCCPRKVNNACHACGGSGWVTRAAFERCPKEAREAVRPAASPGACSFSGESHE